MNSLQWRGRRAGLVPLALSSIALLLLLAAWGVSAHAPLRPTSCTGERFSDVCPGDWFYPPVLDLVGLNAINGYADGTFRPYNTITRGQMMKVLVIATGLTAPAPSRPTFQDVPDTQPFYAWIEIGAGAGIISGYACGGPGEPCDTQNRPYFRPYAYVNRGQIAKIVTLAVGWPPYVAGSPAFRDVPTSSPFYGFIERVALQGAVSGYTCGGPGEPCPGAYFRPGASSTRAQASKIISASRRGGTPVPTPTPGAACAIFPADNIWNRNIAALPTHALSNQYIASIGLNTGLHPDFGSGLYNGGPIGIPYITVTSAQPAVPVTFEYADQSDPGPYPIPTDVPIEGGPDSGGDRHVLVIESGSCTLYEMYSSYPQPDGSWQAGSGALWHLPSHALRPDTWTSADAAGLPILPGLARYDEVAAGAILHALRFTAQVTQRAYLWPARHYASNNTDPARPPMGLRVRLKANVNISGYPTQLRVILQALKDYGMFVADNGSNWYVSGAPDERWDNDALRLINQIHGSDFEAVDESGLMIDPNSGQSR